MAVSSTRLNSIHKSMSNTNIAIPQLSQHLIDQVKLKFNEILYREQLNNRMQGASHQLNNDTISLHALNEILNFVNIQISDYELGGIQDQLLEKDIQSLSFADLVEIVAFIQSEERVFVEFGETKDYR
jgi:hypothetical protein